MRKKLLIVLLAIISVFVCGFGLSACGDDNVPEHKHSYTESVVSPTCTERGYTLYTCECGDEYKDNYTAALDHSFKDYVSDNNVTCIKDGTETAKCERCEETDTRNLTATGHSFTDGKCSVCGQLQPSEGLEYILNLDNKSYIVNGIGSCTDTNIVIADCFNNFPVTVIGESAFSGCYKLISVAIPDSVIFIGLRAFKDCDSLTSITIPDGVTSIGYGVFDGCSSLASITIPNSVTSIDDYAFRGCGSLTNITIPDGVISIGEEAFRGCTGIFQTENGVQYIDKWVVDCDTSVTEVILRSDTKGIARSAFKDCSRLANITIPVGVTFIGMEAFWYCRSITIYCEAESQPSGWNSGWNNGNWNKENYIDLCPVVWDCKVNEIADDGNIYTIIDGIRYALKDGKAMIVNQPQSISGDINIPQAVTYKGNTYSVTSICDSAFGSCSELTGITIPVGVTSIGTEAFWYCHSITIYCEVAGKPSGWNSNWNKENYNNICPVVWDCKNNDVADDRNIYTIIDGVRYALKYDKATVVRQPSNVSVATIPQIVTYKGDTYSVTSIGQSAFEDCSGLTSITIPDSVASIGSIAFSGCSALTSITVSEGNTKYHSSGNCLIETESKKLILGCKNSIISTDGSVTSIGQGAFEDCSGLTSITIPAGVTEIGKEAFYGCSALTSITISDSVNYIGEMAFYGCSNLIQTENGVQYVDKWVIGCETSVTQVTLRTDTKGIADTAFEDCSALTSIIIPDGVTSIGNMAFEDCSSLTSITIPDNVTFIGYRAFLGCSKITSIAIPDGVTEIRTDAFDGCSALTSITIPDSVTSIGGYAFSGCSALTSVTIPDSVTFVGKYAFSGCSKLTIYCEAESESGGWYSDWNNSNCPVVWGYKK